jgi:putative SOS response-associated peptidase YedK
LGPTPRSSGDTICHLVIRLIVRRSVIPLFFSSICLLRNKRDFDSWLSREATEAPPIDLLRPFESEDMEMAPANPLVGNVRNNGPEMLNSA